MAMDPEKLTEYLGKRLTLILLVLDYCTFMAGVIYDSRRKLCLMPQEQKPAEPACKGGGSSDFWTGIRQMDKAALNFGMIVALNIQAKGIKRKSR